MSFEISVDPSAEIPAHPEGRAWAYSFVTPEGSAIFADSRTEIVEQIIVGYQAFSDDELGDDERFEARVDSLAALAASAQALVVAALGDDESSKLEELDEDTVVALFSPKDVITLEFDEWFEDIPLILFATNYAPFSTVRPPAGEHIVWVNPHTETSYIDSLTVLGVGELHVFENLEAA